MHPVKYRRRINILRSVIRLRDGFREFYEIKLNFHKVISIWICPSSAPSPSRLDQDYTAGNDKPVRRTGNSKKARNSRLLFLRKTFALRRGGGRERE